MIRSALVFVLLLAVILGGLYVLLFQPQQKPSRVQSAMPA